MNSYSTLKNKSNAEWNALVNSGEPVIYLGMASCGKAAGADKVKQVILDTLKQYELSARLVEVGCIGTCYLEPLMDISAFGNPRVSFGKYVPAKKGFLSGVIITVRGQPQLPEIIWQTAM